MKKLTLQQAATELNELVKQRLSNTPQDAFLKDRLQQFTDAVQASITDLQQQVDQLRQPKS